MNERRRDIFHTIIRVVTSVAELLLIAVIVISIAVAAYALIDLQSVTKKADKEVFKIYDPSKEKASFEELQAINDEVIGWINIYGTNIDYPLLQTKDNEKYLMTDAAGNYSLAGGIFLDYRNKPDFTDFNNIIHGHNMSYNVMFGDISDFTAQNFFETHRYGDLFFGDRHHGLAIIGLAEADAYKSTLYRLVFPDTAARDSFLADLQSESMYAIDSADLSNENTYVLLSTCTAGMTNGRHILICKLTDEIYENPYGEETKTPDTVGGERLRLRFFLIVLIIIAILLATAHILRRAEKREV